MKFSAFTKAASVAALAGHLTATDAAAQNQPVVVDGSVQNDGGICYQMRWDRVKDTGDRVVWQPGGTTRICFNGAGAALSFPDHTKRYNPDALCYDPRTDLTKRCVSLLPR